MRFFKSKESLPDPYKLRLTLPGNVLVIAERQAKQVGITNYEILIASFDWYDSDYADAFRKVVMEELPSMVPPEGHTTMWPRETRWGVRVKEPDYNSFHQLHQHAIAENLSDDEMAVKALTCHLFNVEADNITFESQTPPRNKQGFTRPEPKGPPLGDPRDLGY